MLESYQQLDPKDRVSVGQSTVYDVVNVPADDLLEQHKTYQNWPLSRDKDLTTVTNLSEAHTSDL